MNEKALIDYFIEIEVVSPEGPKFVCVNVLTISMVERKNNHTLLHLTLPDASGGHVILESCKDYDRVISQVEDALTRNPHHGDDPSEPNP